MSMSKRPLRYYLIPVAIAIVLSILVIGVNKAAAAETCYQHTFTHTWGTWDLGYGQRITDTTTWCVAKHWTSSTTYVPYISSKSTHISGDTIFCSVDYGSAQHWKLAGGVGYPNQQIWWEDEIDFTCPTNIPFVNIHRQDKMAMWVKWNGTHELYWYS